MIKSAHEFNKNQLSYTPKSIIGSFQKEILPCTKWTALVTPLFCIHHLNKRGENRHLPQLVAACL
jgi:hypothetical protein